MVVFEILINMFTMGGWFYEAADVFLGVRSVGISPRLECCNSLLNDFLKGNRMRLFWKVSRAVDEAIELKKLMVEKGLTPDRYTYSVVIDGLCRQKRSEEAKLVLNEMYDIGLNPDRTMYIALIDGFLKENNVDKALRIKEEMVARGVKLCGVTYNVIFAGICKIG
ncbi:putative pentatricopeptide [Rosa chinensis]|uniref:Putative pentatricopeptide n=1 Tax=Rosa chinensis TaxID=74649 RepID=A0A2P6PF50_ROSCH|nr:putative pentatricopeptide [Rosa chinensis]